MTKDRATFVPSRTWTVNAPARLHFGLLDMGNATARRYGGAGLALAGPHTSVAAASAPVTSVHWSTRPLERDAVALERVLQNFLEAFSGRACVSVRRQAPAHVGLGSKTSLVLSALTAVNKACGLEASRTDLQTFSGRGGASGIGINTFFSGGMVVDLGHPARADPFLPSGSASPAGVPPVAVRLVLPSSWRASLFLVRDGRSYSGAAEREFFQLQTPVPRHEVLEGFGVLYHGLVPAACEGSLAAFGEALTLYQSIGFKRRQISNQSDSVRNLLVRLRKQFSAVGMSGMGPLIFVLHDEQTVAADDVAPEALFLGKYELAAHGRTVTFAEG
jgi:beta-ribofuranosylaminobenzene 5'-phosphate synthase